MVPGSWQRAGVAAVAAMAASLAAAGCGDEVTKYAGDPWTRDPPQVGSLAGRIVTTNNGDDTLSVLDPAAPGPAQRLPVGFNPVDLEGPHHVSADAQGRFLYVNLSMPVGGAGTGPHGAHGAASQPGYVVKIDAATSRAAGSVAVDANPGDNTLSADGTTLFVTHYDLVKWLHGTHATNPREGDSNLVLVDTATMTVKARIPLCPAAHGVRLSRDERTLYATCGPDMMAVVDLAASPPAVRRLPLISEEATRLGTCQLCPYALAIAPDGLVWISNLGPSNGSMGRGSLMFFDPRLGDGGGVGPMRILQLRGSPVFAAFVPAGDGYRAYVPEQGPTENAIRVYASPVGAELPAPLDTLSLSLTDCALAHMLTIAADGKRAHLVCEGNHTGPGTFAWIDLAPLAVKGAVPIGVFPDGMAFVPAAP
jgi:hypothetical protein